MRIVLYIFLISVQFSRLHAVDKSASHQSASHIHREIAYQSLVIKKWPVDDLVLHSASIGIIAPEIFKDQILESSLSHIGNTTQLYFFKEYDPSEKDREMIISGMHFCSLMVFITNNASNNPSQSSLLEQIARSKPTICIALSNINDLDLEPFSVGKIALDNTQASFEVIGEWLHATTRPLNISNKQAQEIGNKIWYNECANRVNQLTFWHKYEPFPSFGIGHFIWPSKDYCGTFTEGRFHKFISYLQQQRVAIPNWLEKSRFCPWNTREEFYRDFNSPKMIELRSFLVDTIPYQAQYMLERVNYAFREIILAASVDKRQKVIRQFFNVAQSPNGSYILIDYLNFKHEGTDIKERYQGKGWGLLQVLEEIDENLAENYPEKAFVEAATKVLLRRVTNSPEPGVEKKWIKGWINRLNRYHSE